MKILKYIRIIIYIAILAGLIWLKFTNGSFGECYIKSSLGIECPSCGITRAVIAILNLDFISALNYNAYFVLVLLPMFLVFFIDDIICMIVKKQSFVEIIFRWVRGKL